MIVKTDGYTREQVGKVVQLRANVEGLKLGSGVLERLAEEGEKSSLRYDSSFSLSALLPLVCLIIHFPYQVRAPITHPSIYPRHNSGSFSD